MSEVRESSFASNPRVRAIAGVTLLLALGIGAWLFLTGGREVTDDAQVEGHMTQVAARVGGTVATVSVHDNQPVDAGTVLAEIDPRDYDVALARARAALADAEAASAAAQSNVPVTSTASTSNLSTAQGSVEQAQSAVAAATHEVEVARARLVTVQARVREAEANATRTAKDADCLKGLLAKDEVSHQQFDAATAAAEASRAAADSARSQVKEAEAGIPVAESRLAQMRAGLAQAQAGLRTARTAPEQIAAIRARAQAAEAQVAQAKAALAQAELNLQYTTVKAPTKGIVSRKAIEPGQVIQPGQPLMALISLDDVWVVANYKETQLTHMKPGQRVTLTVDAFGSRTFTGRIESMAAATGARFSLLPPENATGNFVKVVQRVPVKIALDAGQNADQILRPGMSATPTVHTK